MAETEQTIQRTLEQLVQICNRSNGHLVIQNCDAMLHLPSSRCEITTFNFVLDSPFGVALVERFSYDNYSDPTNDATVAHDIDSEQGQRILRNFLPYIIEFIQEHQILIKSAI